MNLLEAPRPDNGQKPTHAELDAMYQGVESAGVPALDVAVLAMVAHVQRDLGIEDIARDAEAFSLSRLDRQTFEAARREMGEGEERERWDQCD